MLAGLLGWVRSVTPIWVGSPQTPSNPQATQRPSSDIATSCTPGSAPRPIRTARPSGPTAKAPLLADVSCPRTTVVSPLAALTDIDRNCPPSGGWTDTSRSRLAVAGL